MAHYKPIPTPPGEAWRLLKTRLFPALIFAVVLLMVVSLWRKNLTASSLPGEVEGLEIIVASQQTGVLAELKVRGFDTVKPAQELARVIGADPKTPAIVSAPAEGSVVRIFRTGGEKVAAGEPLFTIASTPPDRIVAFLRQPVRLAPAVGQPVKISPRARFAPAIGEVLKVAPQLEPIRGPLLIGSQNHPELGLPILVSIPSDLKLYPGEIVDLKLLPPVAPVPAQKSAEPSPAKQPDPPKPPVK